MQCSGSGLGQTCCLAIGLVLSTGQPVAVSESGEASHAFV